MFVLFARRLYERPPHETHLPSLPLARVGHQPDDHRNSRRTGDPESGDDMSEKHFDDGRYYAKGNVVYKSPVKHPKENGSTSYSLGFPVCTASEYVSAENIVAVMNHGDDQARAAIEKDSEAALQAIKAAGVTYG